ncbi:B12-binding domain-containing radical SAM protein [Mucilaginibacter psychrotolerans]|uniref:Radical SAM protein n=1 Tax=Mucilaginibacter psychrotolerans TaxID=1524096 RepID=A0A4Y8S6M3_9SPHI|nr:radical SAM protein [Mucilaginibacter psychrotolerans]TFF34572.1 radical SAM protein [Mucilaginibacter psychrotolerans]
MKVLFVNPHYSFDPFTLLLHPPLAFGYLSNFLKKDGHEVYHADLPFHGNRPEAVLSFIETIQPDVIGLTAVAQSFYHTLEITTLIKQHYPAIPIVAGGPLVTFVPEDVLTRHPSLDYLILYDGEESFVALVNALQARATSQQMKSIPGIAFRDSHGSVIVTPPAPTVSDLDYYGIPDRSIFELKNYLAYDYETVLVTSRGCPSRCTFCSTTLMGRNFRYNSPKHVCDEIEQVLNMGFSSIFFGDDTFSGNSKRTIDICTEINARSLKFNWTSNMRAIDAKPDVLEAMRGAGAYRVFVGFESIQNSTLKLIKKGTTPERLFQKANLIKSYDIELHSAFIIGAPGDSDVSLRETMDFIRIINPTVATFNCMEPRPGTDVYNHPERYGLIMPDKYWYEKLDWMEEPVSYTADLSRSEIKQWINRCYDEFCSPTFLDTHTNDLEMVKAAWA